MNANLFALLETVAAGRGDAMLLEAADGRSVAWAELDPLTARFANALRASGVRPGDRIAVQVEKSVENLLLYLASLRAGAVYLPLNTAYTTAELGYLLGDAEPVLVVCDPARRDAVIRLGPARVETLDAAGRGSLAELATSSPPSFATVPRGADDLAAICYTSGTTGRSKGAMLSHGNLSSNALTLKELWGFTAADRLLHTLPVYHVHGLFVATNTALLAGAGLLWLPRFELDAVFAALPRATAMMGVPTFYTRMLADPRLTREATRHVRLFVSGSAPLLDQIFKDFEAGTGQRILERYGMTETGMITSNPLHGDRRPGTVGLPLPGVTVRLADGESEVGELELKGPNVCQGYWRQPERTAEAFTEDGFFRTGDLATIGADGYVRLVGRAKDLVISGGLNVYPKEIEAVLDAMSEIAESAVIGVPHADFGEVVVAVVTLAPGAVLDEAAIITRARGQLAAFKLPKRVLSVDTLPRNAMGKVEKARLRERFAGLFQGPS